MTPPLVRAEGYRLLGLCFGYPRPDEFCAELSGTACLPDSLGGFTPLAQLVDADLEGEYNRLFSTSVAVAPCETSYLRTDKGARMGQLAALYDAFGARVGGRERERTDHVGSQLEFASLVCLNEAIAEQTNDSERLAISEDVHRVLAREHLATWLPAFVQRLESAAQHPFYQALGPLLDRWVKQDLAEHEWSADPVECDPLPDDDACITCPMAPKGPQ